MRDSLIETEFGEISPDSLTDHLYSVAKDIEKAMIMAGAKPGKDYTYLDLFKLAVTVQHDFEADSNTHPIMIKKNL